MAKSHAVLIVALFAMVGCQQPGLSLNRLPSPSFSGPTIAQRPVVTSPRVDVSPVKPVPLPPSIKPAGPREWIPAVAARPWRWIVIHHSATPTGGAAAFDRMHRDKGWDELGYHFVVGNGSDTGNGAIEVGPRWPKQKWGAHTKTPDNQYNDFGIGICLVGNFDITRPSSEQMRSVSKLVAYMMKTYRIPADHVVRHKDCKSTDCPGAHLSIVEVRRMATQMLADSGAAPDEDTRLAHAEMLTDVNSR